MKDKTSGVPVKGFVVLNSKIYNFITEENHGSEKGKDINKNVFDGEPKYGDYKDVLLNESYMRMKDNHIKNNFRRIIDNWF